MLFYRGLFGLLPGRPRCIECNVPFSGLGSVVAKPLGFSMSSYSPRLCNNCEKYARREQGGAEVELSMLFADVRGSTTLAEAVPTLEFQKLIQRFYRATSEVLVAHNAMVNRLMGDQVIGLFVPRFAGSGHAKVAIHAAQELLRATGHEDPQGAWIPVGAGVHTGMAYVGAVGSKEGVNEIAVLGSAANLAARLSSQAADGEVIVSEAAAASAGLEGEGVENRSLELKGISQPVPVRVMRVMPTSGFHHRDAENIER
jgi:adenylate cyclase